MALSTIQKVVMFSGLVLCVSLLLPKTFLSKGKQPEGSPGRFPSSVPQGKPVDPRAGGFPRSHLSEAVSKAKAGGGGSNSRKSLVGQIIPIYGFGILLYILYILFKLSSKGKNVKMEPKSVPIANGNLKRKITDYELSQLQDKLKETEEAMEKIISRMGPDTEGCKDSNVSNDEEQQLLERLKEITRVMKEGKVLDGVSPEQEAEEAPYMEEWEGYPEETYPVYDPSESQRRHNTILVDRSLLNQDQPTAEEIAEQMEFMEDFTRYCTESTAEDGFPTYDHCDDSRLSPAPTPEDETAPEEQSDDEDPAVIAENAGFSSDMASDSEQGPEASPADPAVNGDVLETIRYPEETYPVYDPSESQRCHNTILVDRSLLNQDQPTAEEIAEQMEFMEDFTRYCTESAAEDGFTTYDHCDDSRLSPAPTPEDETAPEEQSDDEDPAVIAENAGFSSDMASDSEQGPEASPADPAVNGDVLETIRNSLGEESQSLRKRGKKTPDC